MFALIRACHVYALIHAYERQPPFPCCLVDRTWSASFVLVSLSASLSSSSRWRGSPAFVIDRHFQHRQETSFSGRHETTLNENPEFQDIDVPGASATEEKLRYRTHFATWIARYDGYLMRNPNIGSEVEMHTCCFFLSGVNAREDPVPHDSLHFTNCTRRIQSRLVAQRGSALTRDASAPCELASSEAARSDANWRSGLRVSAMSGDARSCLGTDATESSTAPTHVAIARASLAWEGPPISACSAGRSVLRGHLGTGQLSGQP